MKSERDFLRQFAQSLLEPSPPKALLEDIVEEGISAQDRLNIYRSNVYGSLSRALAQAYPVVLQVIGEENFRSLSRAYIQAYPPSQAHLATYGSRLAAFVSTFEPAQEIPYLSDLAALEWAQIKAYFASPARTLDYEALQNLSPERRPQVVFDLAPSATVLMSEFPILKIWEMYHEQTLNRGSLDWDGIGDCALVFRPNQAVETHRLDLAAAILFHRLDRKENFQQAAKMAVECDPEFDLEGTLVYYLEHGLFVDFSL